MKMDDEVAHLGIIHRRLGLRPPGRLRGGVVGIDADDVEPRQVLEGDPLEILELSSEDEMEKLLGAFLRHADALPPAVEGPDPPGAVMASIRTGCNRLGAARSAPWTGSAPL